MFIDEIQIKAIAGKGGDGSISFRREKYVPKGGPDGGNGGKGGNLTIKANTNLNTLGHLAHKKIFKAENGENGKGKNMTGKTGTDLTIETPVGTLVLSKDKSQILADLNSHNQEIIIAKGGKGGFGNLHFLSSTHQVPRFAENGEPGEEKEIVLELKLVADVGLIGLPSAGKSTLISVISNARPKIAAYHFTTLSPNLGVVYMSTFGGSTNDTFVVADIPGLIEGASEGKGLGHQFLKHITRTKILVHIIDGSLENTAEDYKTIVNELKNFSKELAKKKQIVVINKTDLLTEEQIKEKINELKKIKKTMKIFPISAVAHQGLKPLMFEILKTLKTEKNKEKLTPQKKQIPVLKPHLTGVNLKITKTPEGDKRIFQISGKRLEQMVIMTDLKNIEGLERIYYYLEKSGIKRAIEKRGAEFGDIIRIGQKSFPYRK